MRGPCISHRTFAMAGLLLCLVAACARPATGSEDPSLGELLGASTVAAQLYGLERLARSGGPEHVALISTFTGSSEERLRLAALRALARIDDAEAAAFLLEDLRFGAVAEQEVALEWAVRTRYPGVREEILQVAEQRGERTPVGVWIALGRLGEARALAPLLAGLADEAPHPGVPAALAALARTIGFWSVWEAFRVRPQACLVPFFEAWPDAAAPLARLAADAEMTDAVRATALQSLARVSPSDALVPLRAALIRGNARLQRTAADVLASLDDPRAHRLLLEILGSEVCVVKAEVVAALARLGARLDGDLLAEALRDPVRRATVLRVLVARTDREARLLAREHAADPDPEVRRLVARILATAGQGADLDLLLELAGDDRPQVTQAAHLALARVISRLLAPERGAAEVAAAWTRHDTALLTAVERLSAALPEATVDGALAAADAVLSLLERPGSTSTAPTGQLERELRDRLARRLAVLVREVSRAREAELLDLLARTRSVVAEETLRRLFAEALGLWLPADTIVMPLAGGLEEARVRWRAARGLASREPAPLGARLTRARERRRSAERPEPGRVARLAWLLGGLGSGPVIADATRILAQAEAEEARLAAARVLAAVERPGDVACAAGLARFPEGAPETRTALLPLLARCASSPFLDGLLRLAARGAARPELREAALGALLRAGPARALEALADGDRGQRNGVLAVLSELPGPAALAVLAGPTWQEEADALRAAVTPLLGDREPRIRARAVAACGRLDRLIGDAPRARRLLLRADDPAAAVRAAAVSGAGWTFRTARRQELPAVLLDLVTDPASEVRTALADELTRWPAPAATRLLVLLLLDPDGGIRQRAVTALGARELPGLAESLADAARAGPREVTLAAIAGLARSAEPVATDLLVGFLATSDDLEVRDALVTALAAREPERVLPALREQLLAAPAAFRWRVLQVLSRLEGLPDPGPLPPDEAALDELTLGAGPVRASTATGALGDAAPAAPVLVGVVDAPDDSGGALEVRWRPSLADPAASPGSPPVAALGGYELFRRPGGGGAWRLVAEVPAGQDRFLDEAPRLADGGSYQYAVAATGPSGRAVSPASAAVAAEGQWLHRGRVGVLLLVSAFTGLLLVFYHRARRERADRRLYVRPLDGVESIRQVIRQAAAQQRPVLFSSGLGEISDIGTVASLSILSTVARTAAECDVRLLVPCRDPVVFTASQEAVRQGCAAAGRPAAYHEEDVFFVAGRQFAYAAAVSGLMLRERPAAHLFIGLFYAEALLLAETGAATGAVQVAATDRVTQLPFFITSCDHTLIGEELYAAGAYLGRAPSLLGGLKAQDWTKAAIILVLGLGALAGLLGALGWTWWDGVRAALLGLVG